ncbi:MAG TPA: serine--tRNA ligase [Candidatus Cloacimonetes bacterium]|nr:serine--tRNA ligase [Candidatus Cloacimonadota bacterium]HEX37572.1 serine--tRNA ligase [Candidatus Cloacimonadota bacterium]
MLDIKFIRNNPELVRECVKNKGEKTDISLILKLDRKHKALLFEFEEKRKLQNAVSKDIAQAKKKGENADTLIADMKQVAEETKVLQQKIKILEEELNGELLTIPNIFDESVTIGNDEADNKLIREWGVKPVFDFKPLDHLELSEKLGLMDFQRAAKITGSGYPCYIGWGAKLERALINYMLDFQTEVNGYTEVFPPFIANRQTMTGTGQLPKLENDMYHIDEDDLFLIPTGEVPLTNLHQNEILSEDKLPLKYTAYTPCFRREAGSYGKDTKGLQRIHQFNKVELVQFVKPEDSEKALQEILANAEAILQNLGIPYRVMQLCSGDLSFAAYKCYDIEVWSAGMEKYLEASSCSNFIDFQARRAQIRFRSSQDGKVHYVHTLNGSGVATSRTMIALLENNQTKQGEIEVPEVLRKYIGGREKIA